MQHAARSFLGISPTTVANESDFSRLKQLLTDQRKGKMSEETVSRKMGLMLNPSFWSPNPELSKPREGRSGEDKFWADIVTKAKLGTETQHDAALGDDDEEDEEWWWL